MKNLIKFFLRKYKERKIDLNRKKVGMPSLITDKMVFVLEEDYLHPMSKKIWVKGTKLYPYTDTKFLPEGGESGSGLMMCGIPFTVKHGPKNIYSFSHDI